MSARTDRFFLLDSLRGVAALMVLAVHASWFSGAGLPGAWFGPYSARFEAAFAIFFAISGFLLYRPFVKARLLDLPPVSSPAYGWRRFLRIVPAFWVALIVIATCQGSDLWTAREVLRNFGFLQLYYGGGPSDVIPQAWTLCVEVTFYASLPLWAALMRRVRAPDFQARLRTEVWALSAVVIGSLAYSAFLAYSHAVRTTFAPGALLSALPGYMDHIGLGMLLAVVSVRVEQRTRGTLPQTLAFFVGRPWLCWLVAIGSIVVGAQLLGVSTTYTPTGFMFRHMLNSLIAVAVLIPAVFGDAREGLVRRLLGNRALVYLGLISYGFYLYHWAVLEQLLRWKLEGRIGFLTSYVSWFGVALAGAAVLGSLSYYLVERPALSLKRVVPSRPRREPDEALAEPAPAAPVTTTPAS
jgi:peptidoglycan/LPS O-acetylase OafA/YrhL